MTQGRIEPRRILVTGGSGFVGRRLIETLRAQGFAVAALARSDVAAGTVMAAGAEVAVRGDLADVSRWGQHLAGIDTVIHAAAHLKFGAPSEAFRRLNVGATRALLEGAKAAGVRSFIFVGAASVVMGRPAPMDPVDETAPLTNEAWMPYSRTKAEAERLVLASGDAMRVLSVRPPLIWGAGDAFDHDLGAAIRAGQFAHFGRGDFPYSVCHVDNACAAIVAALERGRSGESYFVADGETTTARAFFDARIVAMGLRPVRLSVPSAIAFKLAAATEATWRAFRLSSDMPITREVVRLMGWPFVLDIAKARRDLGYVPVVSRDAGMAKLRGRDMSESNREIARA
jgi:nucleoside-diphosphate-sugar epimerase